MLTLMEQNSPFTSQLILLFPDAIMKLCKSRSNIVIVFRIKQKALSLWLRSIELIQNYITQSLESWLFHLAWVQIEPQRKKRTPCGLQLSDNQEEDDFSLEFRLPWTESEAT